MTTNVSSPNHDSFVTRQIKANVTQKIKSFNSESDRLKEEANKIRIQEEATKIWVPNNRFELVGNIEDFSKRFDDFSKDYEKEIEEDDTNLFTVTLIKDKIENCMKNLLDPFENKNFPRSRETEKVIVNAKTATPNDFIYALAYHAKEGQANELYDEVAKRPLKSLEIWQKIPIPQQNEIDNEIYLAWSTQYNEETKDSKKGQHLREELGLSNRLILKALQNYCLKNRISSWSSSKSIVPDIQSNASVPNSNVNEIIESKVKPIIEALSDIANCPVELELTQDLVSLVPCGHSLSQKKYDEIKTKAQAKSTFPECPLCKVSAKDATPNWVARSLSNYILKLQESLKKQNP